jgi:dsRNA-specific ribonuclease
MQSPDPTLVAPRWPPLPQLHGDLMLDVFTHHSITQGILNDQTPHGNSERLAQLGQSVLDTIVTCVLFDERPMLSGEELKVRW